MGRGGYKGIPGRGGFGDLEVRTAHSPPGMQECTPPSDVCVCESICVNM